LYLSGGAGKKKKVDSKVGSPTSAVKDRANADKKNLIQILKDADPEASKEEIERFVKFVSELLVFLKIQDDPMT
jgi:hypothetical protein